MNGSTVTRGFYPGHGRAYSDEDHPSHAVEDALFRDAGVLCRGDGVEEVVGELLEGGGADPFRGSVARVCGQEAVQHRARVAHVFECPALVVVHRRSDWRSTLGVGVS